MTQNRKRIARAVVIDEEVRDAVVQELGLQNMNSKDQDEIMAIMRETILTNIDTAVLQALGPKGVAALGEIPENDDKLFAQKMSAALPNLSDIVKSAINESLASYRESAMRALEAR